MFVEFFPKKRLLVFRNYKMIEALEALEALETLETYFPNIGIVVPIFSVCVSSLIFYFSHRSRKREQQDRKRHEHELKKIYESTTHQPAEFTTTQKPTEEYRKFLEKPINRKIPKKFSIVRPSPSAFKTFLFGLLVLFLDVVLLLFWNDSSSGISDDLILFVILILFIYAFYLGVSSIVRGLYKAFTRKILLSLIVLFIILLMLGA